MNKAISAERDSLLGEKDRLKAELDALKGEVTFLKSSNQIKLEDNASLSTALEHNLDVNQVCKPLSKSLESFGGFKKVTDVSSRAAVVRAAIVAILSILMRQTKPLMRLRTIVDTLYKHNIFGIEVT